HDELDAAVAGAYGWPADLPDEEILSRLVALNAERVEEEKNGLIRWLRPEYQAKSKAERNATQVVLDFPQVAAPEPAPAPASRLPWPAALVDQMQAVRGIIAALKAANTPISAEAIAAHFVRASRSKVEEILQAFDTLGL
ncbi:MAG: class I SAM-dependent DNA methyltransferase, partial [Candidatus Adiutrix sp.]|nr:class I SAM-dependent DNA methyltransferase [Candidatus Adiutrix sp.]